METELLKQKRKDTYFINDKLLIFIFQVCENPPKDLRMSVSKKRREGFLKIRFTFKGVKYCFYWPFLVLRDSFLTNVPFIYIEEKTLGTFKVDYNWAFKISHTIERKYEQLVAEKIERIEMDYTDLIEELRK